MNSITLGPKYHKAHRYIDVVKFQIQNHSDLLSANKRLASILGLKDHRSELFKYLAYYLP